MILLSSASLSESMNQCLETTSAESETINPIITEQIFTGYLSDLPTSDESDSDEELDSETPNRDEAGHHAAETHPHPTSVLQLPPLKRRRLEIPTRLARQQKRVQKRKALEEGLNDIEKRIQSKKEVFDAGQHGLQAYRARAIQSCLWMIIRNKRNQIEASKQAAESRGFS